MVSHPVGSRRQIAVGSVRADPRVGELVADKASGNRSWYPLRLSSCHVLGAVLEDLLWRQVDAVGENRAHILVQHKHELSGDLVKVVLPLHQALYSVDCTEALVHSRIASASVQDSRADDHGKIVQIHSTARFLVDVGKRCNPLEEDEQHFDCVTVAAW